MPTHDLKPTSSTTKNREKQLPLDLPGESLLAEVERVFQLELSQFAPARATARLMGEFRLAMQRVMVATARASIHGHNQAMRTLVQLSEGRVEHLYAGLCPDQTNGHASRDPACVVCQALTLSPLQEVTTQGVVPPEFVMVPRALPEQMELAFLEVWFARARPIDDPGMQDAWEAALDARPQESIDPNSANFKEGFATGRGEAEFLAGMIGNPACSRCGATSELDAESKCRPGGYGGDECPGTEWPLAHLWAMHTRAESPNAVVEHPQAAGKED